MKPILFNTEMVQAILSGRKICTRRLLRSEKLPDSDIQFGYTAFTPDSCISVRGNYGGSYGESFIKLPFKPGDVLYVRETWSKDRAGKYVYRADNSDAEKWHPSLHMPKDAARAFLIVKSVRAERLKEMTLGDVLNEGVIEGNSYEETWDKWHKLWNSTVKPSDLSVYGIEANPFVWVINFRLATPEEVSAHL